MQFSNDQVTVRKKVRLAGKLKGFGEGSPGRKERR